jgi:ABC-type polysaccharide/polyol phosphate export permease
MRLELAFTLAERALRLRIKRTWIAGFWPLVAPGFLMGLWLFVGRAVFSVDIPHYPSYLFAGLVAWTFASATVGRSLGTLSADAELIRRARFPYELLPLGNVAANAVYLLVLLGGLGVYSASRGWLEPELLPLLVLPLAALLLLVGALSLLLSLFDVHNRDLRMVLPSLLTVWFFTTPIVYRPSMLSDAARSLVELNPLTPIVVNVRSLLVFGNAGDTVQISVVLGCCAALFGVCMIIFRRWGRDLARTI